LALKGRRLRRRVAMEHGGTRHVTLLQPYSQSVLEIDGGKQNHGAHRRKFAISFNPKR